MFLLCLLYWCPTFHPSAFTFICASVIVHPSVNPGTHTVSLRCALNWKLRTQGFFMRTVKTMTRLGRWPGWLGRCPGWLARCPGWLARCPGWSESLLCTQVIVLVLSCCGSFDIHSFQILCSCTEGQFGPRHEKICLCHMRTTKAHISLCIRAVWSAPFWFAA